MRKLVIVVCLWLFQSAYAQHGLAPNGYYPVGYNGHIFTGSVTHKEGNSLTLTFTKGTKTETFEGLIKIGCNVPRANGSKEPLMPEEIPLNSKIVVYFEPHKIKVNGEKHTDNEIIAISFEEYQGKTIPENQRAIYNCLGSSALAPFRAFH